MQPDLRDQASLQRGAGLYMNYCMGCHSLDFSRYERVADDLDIPHDLMREHLMFDPDQKIGALMENAMDEDLAKKLANPIASLISVPFQFNYDEGFGTADGEHVLLNVQPVVPISLNNDWNVISRTILPVKWQNDIAGSSGSQFGIGDTLQSLFLSPKATPQVGSLGNLTWGGGPALSLPTGTDDLLGSEKWAAGRTGIALFQNGPWLYGALVNHLWSYGGADGRADVDATFMQPFLTYTTKTALTYAINLESTYDWEAAEWSIPINLMISKLTTIGGQKVSFQGGVRYWADSPDSGADGFGARFTITFLFPK